MKIKLLKIFEFPKKNLKIFKTKKSNNLEKNKTLIIISLSKKYLLKRVAWKPFLKYLFTKVKNPGGTVLSIIYKKDPGDNISK